MAWPEPLGTVISIRLFVAERRQPLGWLPMVERGRGGGLTVGGSVTRAPFQVLVFPYRVRPGTGLEYAVFRRADLGIWQAISGGGEDAETPLEAAKREALEEGRIPRESKYLALHSRATIPVVGIAGHLLWGDDVLVVPEHCFGVEADGLAIALSHEHVEFRWIGYEAADALLKYDSNKTALWELDMRLRRQAPPGSG